MCISPIAFAGADVLPVSVVAAVLLGAVAPLEIVLPVTDPGAEGAGLGNVAGGLGSCAARDNGFFCVDPEPTILDGRGRAGGTADAVLGVGDMAVLEVGSFFGAEVDDDGARDCRFVAVEEDTPGTLAVVVADGLVLDVVVPGTLAPGARDCLGFEIGCDNDCR